MIDLGLLLVIYSNIGLNLSQYNECQRNLIHSRIHPILTCLALTNYASFLILTTKLYLNWNGDFNRN